MKQGWGWCLGIAFCFIFFTANFFFFFWQCIFTRWFYSRCIRKTKQSQYKMLSVRRWWRIYHYNIPILQRGVIVNTDICPTPCPLSSSVPLAIVSLFTSHANLGLVFGLKYLIRRGVVEFFFCSILQFWPTTNKNKANTWKGAISSKNIALS